MNLPSETSIQLAVRSLLSRVDCFEILQGVAGPEAMSLHLQIVQWIV